ncbi:hypothetical protein FGRMN_8143 [Fusarium graminum]|nr:hypothetical protein FGRMN_8143 [Fusarium graminum]
MKPLKASTTEESDMDAGASILAFVQAAGQTVKLIIKVKKLWDEAKGIPEEFQGLLEELDILALDLQELKEQLDHDRKFNPNQSKSSIERSFLAVRKARNILQGFVNEVNSKIISKKEGLPRTIGALKFLMKKDILESYQKRLKRAIDELHIAISIRHIVKSDFRQQFAELQPELISMIQTTIRNEQKLANSQSNTQSVRDEVLAEDKSGDSQRKRSWLAYKKEPKSWRAQVQLPAWLSKAVYDIQVNTAMYSWNFAFRSYNIISHKSEIVQTIEKGDKNGVLKLFDARMASPYDKDQRGYSLLYFAAQSKQYEICQILLKLGLKGSLTEVVGEARESPLKPLVYKPQRQTPESEWNRIVELFQAYLQGVDEMPVVRLFDFIHEWTYSDDFMFVFKDRFMPKYYHWPLRDRLEAVRLGSFHVLTYTSFLRLLSQDSIVTKSDVSQSSGEKLSLLHSAAIALGIRYADEPLPYKRAEFQWRVYNKSWRTLVTKVASVAAPEDLHSIELVSPWDVHHVSHWRGTPLVSVIGGALCYLSPDISFVHWDVSLQQTVHEWLEGLRLAGVDLDGYGQEERSLLHGGLKGAFDADAITASRTMIRESLARAAYGSKVSSIADEGWNVNHWVPIRIIDLATGPNVEDWRVIWAPEFEYMAHEFWDLIEVRDKKSVMPGSWTEEWW